MNAFSLVEVLAVVSLMSVLCVMVAPAVSSIAIGGKNEQALIEVSGAFEKAREYAVAHSAFVYVGLTSPDADGRIYLGIFGANDGSSGGVSNIAGEGNFMINSDSSRLVLLDRPVLIEDVLMEDQIPASNALSARTSLAANPSALTRSLNFSYEGSSRGRMTFTRVIQFTPQGEGRVAGVLPEAVQLVLVPTKGSQQIRNDAGASAIQISGLTGQVAVYRPGT